MQPPPAGDPLAAASERSLPDPSARDSDLRSSAGPAAGPRGWRLLAWIAVLGGAYAASAALGLNMAFIEPHVSPVWPPAGIALAGLLRLGWRAWPGVAIGALLANAADGEPLALAAALAAGNTLEALAGAWMLRRLVGLHDDLRGRRDVLGVVGLAAGVSTMIAATVGVASLTLAGYAAPSDFRSLWWVWWLGDAMGILVIAPLLLVWTTRAAGRWRFAQLAELGALLLGLVVAGWVVFGRSQAIVPAPEHLVFPFLIWAALRFRQSGVTLVTLCASALAVSGTLAGAGPFAGATAYQGLIQLQTYMAVVAVTGMLMAAVNGERGELETALRDRAAALADADRRKDEFLAMLAHELRNPLAPLRNAVHVLSRGPVDGAAGRRLLDIMGRQVSHLGRLVEDLLDVARISRGEFSLHTEPLDLREVAERAVESTRTLLESRYHELRLELPTEPLTVDGDALRLEQVVTNLLNNAAKYTDPGGHLSLTLAGTAGAVELRVNDDGIGIPAELHERIFDAFVQGQRGLDRAQGGLGVGLTLVRRIVHLHGGRIEARSDGPGNGSCFVVRLPPSAAQSGRTAASA